MNRVRRMVVAAVAAASVVLATSTAARAAFVFNHTDGFDSSPAATWLFVGTGGFEYNQGTALTAPNNAWVTAPGANTWSSVGKPLTLPATGGAWIDCDAVIYVRAAWGARVNFEIINRADWRYIALLPVTLSPSTSYQRLALNNWSGQARNIFVRVAIIGDGSMRVIRVDQLSVHCDYEVIE